MDGTKRRFLLRPSPSSLPPSLPPSPHNPDYIHWVNNALIHHLEFDGGRGHVQVGEAREGES